MYTWLCGKLHSITFQDYNDVQRFWLLYYTELHYHIKIYVKII